MRADVVRRTELRRPIEGRSGALTEQLAFYSLLERELCMCGPHSQRNLAARCLAERVRAYHQAALRQLPKRERFRGTID